MEREKGEGERETDLSGIQDHKLLLLDSLAFFNLEQLYNIFCYPDIHIFKECRRVIT